MSAWVKSSDRLPVAGQWVICNTARGFFIGQFQHNPFVRVMNWDLSKWYQGFTHWKALDLPELEE